MYDDTRMVVMFRQGSPEQDVSTLNLAVTATGCRQ